MGVVNWISAVTQGVICANDRISKHLFYGEIIRVVWESRLKPKGVAVMGFKGLLIP
jgi:hypothetical protein